MVGPGAAKCVTPADHGRVMTLDEFCAGEKTEGDRDELTRGVVEVADIPDNDDHGVIVCNRDRALSLSRYHRPGTLRRFGSAGDFRPERPGVGVRVAGLWP